MAPTQYSSVLLPLPDGPVTATASPRFMVSEMAERIRRGPDGAGYSMLTDLTSSTSRGSTVGMGGSRADYRKRTAFSASLPFYQLIPFGQGPTGHGEGYGQVVVFGLLSIELDVQEFVDESICLSAGAGDFEFLSLNHELEVREKFRAGDGVDSVVEGRPGASGNHHRRMVGAARGGSPVLRLGSCRRREHRLRWHPR